MRSIMLQYNLKLRNRNQIIAKFNSRYPATRISGGILTKAIYDAGNTMGGLAPVYILE